MKHLTQLTFTALAALSLSACGGGEMDHSKMDDAKMDHSTMDHSKMDQMKSMGDTGHTTGIIVSVSPDGKEATIDHQEIEGVGMGAMTMGFGITSAVDLSGFAKDDNVSFMVKKGRDGSYRITAICNTDTDGKDCLDAKMDHSGH
ncbi:copper-binding protein [Fretibacter rubidus]|uniref:copper-binding protein n=1 Tax=Fretibacter rubidus TaxID=570162 RepID=UPI00352B9D34